MDVNCTHNLYSEFIDMPRKSWSVSSDKTGNGQVSKKIKQFDDPKEINLWRTWTITKDLCYRNILVKRYLEFAYNEADIYFKIKIPHKQSSTLDELRSDASLGLLDAVDSYDYTRGVRFQNFARQRVRGAMLDGLRTMQHFPRIIAGYRRQILPKWEALRNELGREPKPAEFLVRYGEEFRCIIEDELLWSNVYCASSSSSNDSEDSQLDDFAVLDNGSESKPLHDPAVDRLSLISFIDKLLDNTQLAQIITLYYFQDFTCRKIAGVMRQSTSSIVLKRAKALDILSEHKYRLQKELLKR